MKFSIIIPVYNSEKYLCECLDSILKQRYQNIEIILIDDGSTDTSPRICDKYAQQDKRVKAVHQRNSGTAEARNSGIRIATGEYIMFIDNDDYWANDFVLEEIKDQLSESHADVLMFNMMEYWDNKEKYTCTPGNCKREQIVFQSRETALENLIANGMLHCTVWTKVVRTELIRTNDLYFEKGIRNEDTEWIAKLLLCAKSFDWYEKIFYAYRRGTGVAQTDRKPGIKEVTDLKNICEKYIKIGQSIEQDKQAFRSLFYSYLAYPFAVLMGQIEFLEKDQAIKLRNFAKRYATILQYDVNPSVKIVKKVYSLLGYTITVFLLKIYLLYKCK